MEHFKRPGALFSGAVLSLLASWLKALQDLILRQLGVL